MRLSRFCVGSCRKFKKCINYHLLPILILLNLKVWWVCSCRFIYSVNYKKMTFMSLQYFCLFCLGISFILYYFSMFARLIWSFFVLHILHIKSFTLRMTYLSFLHCFIEFDCSIFLNCCCYWCLICFLLS